MVIYQIPDEPWVPAYATTAIRKISRHPDLSLAYKVHATQRLVERGLLTSDILYLLKNGFVLVDAELATRPEYFRYVVTSTTPNSGGREIGAVVIPDASRLTIKVVTVYWVDEEARRAGSL